MMYFVDKQSRLLLLLIIFLPLTLYRAAAETENQVQLEGLRGKIKYIAGQIKDAQTEIDKLQKELRDNEVTTAKILALLDAVQPQIKQKNVTLEKLQVEQLEHEKELKIEQGKLVAQICATYKINRNDYIKLILNQEDPARIGRALAYRDYHNRAQSRRINRIRETLQDISNIQQAIRVETNILERLRVEYENKLDEFQRYRASRYDIISRLQNEMKEQEVTLHTLQINEKELSKILSSLEESKSKAATRAVDMPKFVSLKGQLQWPVKGKLLKQFGHRKKGANLKWQGVLIDAESGTRVNAISAGKVVFADWFSNLGLLIIVDHGDGYMSVYGHNQNLLKNIGDQVFTGETIATVGDSGGQSNTALYFEIRHGAKPLNPTHWCRR